MTEHEALLDDVGRPCGRVVSDTERVLASNAARAVGRFRPDGPSGYLAATAPAAPMRSTRDEAERDERAWLDLRSAGND